MNTDKKTKENSNLPIFSVSTSFLCDVCGEKKTGEKHKMYDENWDFEGCYECNDCFEEKMIGQIGEY